MITRFQINSESPQVTQFGISYDDVKKLIAALDREDLHGRRTARATMRSMGPASLPALIQALRSHSLSARQGAAELLRQVPDATAALEALTEAVNDPDWLVRMWSADALARMGPAAHSALSALRRAAHDPVVHVRTAAYLAIHWITATPHSAQ
jgi:HEAT repeat protein